MSNPPVAIKVSSDLAESARAEATAADRSLTGQVEHWAKLGRAVEGLVTAPIANALKGSAGNLDSIEDGSIRIKVLKALAAFRALDPQAIRRKIGIDQQIVFESDPSNPSGVVQVHPDGRRIRGRIEARTFIPLES